MPTLPCVVALDSLSSADYLLIKTASSSYRFLVTDPAKRRGILMGGALGVGAADAVMLGAEIRTKGQVSGLFSKLCEGTCGTFFVSSADGVKQLVTSPIARPVRASATTDHSKSRTCVSGDDTPHAIS